jgi:LysR family transcriptional regulator, nitrogen assimilation regulatory protein
MEMRQMQYFAALFEEGSVTRAARRLHVVQPAISMQISKLEDELGQKLFERTPKGMVPTAAGRQAYALLVPLLRDFKSVRDELVGFGGKVAGHISIGVIASVSNNALSECLESFCAKYPDVSLSVTGGYTVDFMQMLEMGKLDIAVINQTSAPRSLGATDLLQEDLALIASADNPCQFEQPVALSDIARMDIVIPSTRHGLRTIIDDVANRVGVQLQPKLEFDELKMVEDFVQNTNYLTILPPIAIRRALASGRLRRFSITPRITRNIVCVHNARRALSEPARLFIAEFKSRMDAAWLEKNSIS